jgi:hypothetical protein
LSARPSGTKPNRSTTLIAGSACTDMALLSLGSAAAADTDAAPVKNVLLFTPYSLIPPV